MTEYDEIPIRLPSGTKAVVRLPRPFTLKDAMHMLDFLQLYIEEEVKPKAHLVGAVPAGPESIRPAPGEARPFVERRRYPESGME
jgi:hypothetical protein